MSRDEDLDASYLRGWFEGVEDSIDALLELPEDCNRERAISRVEDLVNVATPLPSTRESTVRVDVELLKTLFRCAESYAGGRVTWRQELADLRALIIPRETGPDGVAL